MANQTDLRDASERELLRVTLNALQERLPPSWSLTHAVQAGPGGFADADLLLTAPDGARLSVLVAAKRSLVTRDVPGLVDRLRRQAGSGDAILPMVVTRYLARPTREAIRSQGAAYADATGNISLSWGRPGLFVLTSGADHDPWRARGRPRGSLGGAAAARLVRALVDFRPPISVPRLARLANVSIGAAYRVVDLLGEEALVEREDRGPIAEVQWRALIERWSRDHGFAQSNTITRCFEPRGIHVLLRGLRQLELRYALSGSLGAFYLAPHAEVRAAAIYVDDPDAVAARLGLRPADGTANVLLASGSDEVIFARTRDFDDLRRVAPSQAAVDLLTGPGRNPAEAMALMDWMEAHEDEWRAVVPA